MSLTQTRPEKSYAMEVAAYSMREALVKICQENDLNHAEAINATAHVLASLLAGAYSTDKDREIVLSAVPDVVRAYIPQWLEIYEQVLAKATGADK